MKFWGMGPKICGLSSKKWSIDFEWSSLFFLDHQVWDVRDVFKDATFKVERIIIWSICLCFPVCPQNALQPATHSATSETTPFFASLTWLLILRRILSLLRYFTKWYPGSQDTLTERVGPRVGEDRVDGVIQWFFHHHKILIPWIAEAILWGNHSYFMRLLFVSAWCHQWWSECNDDPWPWIKTLGLREEVPFPFKKVLDSLTSSTSSSNGSQLLLMMQN